MEDEIRDNAYKIATGHHLTEELTYDEFQSVDIDDFSWDSLDAWTTTEVRNHITAIANDIIKLVTKYRTKTTPLDTAALSDVQEIEGKLEEVKVAYRELEGKKLLNEILEADDCPQLLNDLAIKYKFTQVSFVKMVHNGYHMPEFGKYIVFEGTINTGTEEAVSLEKHDFGFLIEESESYVEIEYYHDFDGTAYIRESNFASTLEDNGEIANNYSDTEQGYNVWEHITSYAQEGYRRELFQ